jgi:hypothetical protein
MQDERELNVELDPERGGEEMVPVRVASDELKPDTLRAVIESFVLREGTDYTMACTRRRSRPRSRRC